MKKIYLAGLLALAILAAPSAAVAEDIDWTFGKRLDTAEKKIKALEDKVAALEGAQKVGAKPTNPPVTPTVTTTKTTYTYQNGGFVKTGDACPVGGCLQPGECGRTGCTANCAVGCPAGGTVGVASSATYSESYSTGNSGRIIGSGFIRGLFSRLKGRIRGGGGCCSSGGFEQQQQYAPAYNQQPTTYAPAPTVGVKSYSYPMPYYGTSGSAPAGWTCTSQGCFKTK